MMSRLVHLPRLAAVLAISAATVGGVATAVHADIPAGVTASIDLEYDDCPDVDFSGHLWNNGQSTTGAASFTYTIVHANGDPTTIGGVSWPSGIPAGQFGYHAYPGVLEPGDTISASIVVGGDTAASITDVEVQDCVGDGTVASVAVVCEGETAQLEIDLSNNFPAEDAITYDVSYTIVGSGGPTGSSFTQTVDQTSPYELDVPVQPGDVVSAEISYDGNAYAEIENFVAPDCSDDDAGAGIPDAGGTPTPLVVSAAGLLAAGMALTLTGRRRRTA